MSRAAILATIVTSLLAFSSPSLAASDAEILRSGYKKMSSAFRCSTYALMFHDQKEQRRLIQIGRKAGRHFVKALKSSNDPALGGDVTAFARGVSRDFMIGMLYETESTKASDEIVKYDDGLPRTQWLDSSEAKSQAELAYRKSNCSLIQ